MKALQGTEKQIAWAEKIRETILKMFNEKITLMESDEKSIEIKNELIRNRQYFRNKVKTTVEARTEYAHILEEIKEAILQKENANWFIAYKNIDIEFCVNNYFNYMTGSEFPKAK